MYFSLKGVGIWIQAALIIKKCQVTGDYMCLGYWLPTKPNEQYLYKCMLLRAWGPWALIQNKASPSLNTNTWFSQFPYNYNLALVPFQLFWLKQITAWSYLPRKYSKYTFKPVWNTYNKYYSYKIHLLYYSPVQKNLPNLKLQNIQLLMVLKTNHWSDNWQVLNK